MTLTIKVECPRCKKTLTGHEGESDAQCDCHLYCEDGDNPNDCSVTTQSFSGQLGWPTHLRTGLSLQESGDDEMHRVRYCSTHSKYIYKVPILVPLDWSNWFSRRAKPKHRLHLGKI